MTAIDEIVAGRLEVHGDSLVSVEIVADHHGGPYACVIVDKPIQCYALDLNPWAWRGAAPDGPATWRRAVAT